MTSEEREASPVPAQICEQALTRYSAYYDIERDCEVLGERLAGRAEFHSRGEKYVLVRRAKLWAMECNDYVFVFCEQALTAQRAAQLLAWMRRCETAFVKPHGEHMYSYLTLLVAAQTAEPQAVRLLQKAKQMKNYKFGFEGYSELRCGLFDCARQRLVTNRAGRALAKTFRGIYPRSAEAPL